jgi:GTP-binding protein HflX
LFAAGQNIVITDTVGFIRELPTTLIAAFRATLEEALNADLLLHVIDAANPERDAQIAQVNTVLADIGVNTVPQCWVMNKIDLLNLPARIESDVLIQKDLQTEMHSDTVSIISLSAKTGAGINFLRDYLGNSALANATATLHILDNNINTFNNDTLDNDNI